MSSYLNGSLNLVRRTAAAQFGYVKQVKCMFVRSRRPVCQTFGPPHRGVR